jgi:photosystem II stability/assembly factor-like uncharacterized protein
MEKSGTTAGLRGVHAVGGGVVWASGEHGTVLRTEDSGYMWQSCAMPPGAEKLDFRGIWAWDANTAIVMSSGPGEQSRLYKTTDGCSHWTLVYTNPDKDGFWDAMAFWDTAKGDQEGLEDGVLLGDPVGGAFARFVVGGRGTSTTPEKDVHDTSAKEGEGAFTASNSSLVLGRRFQQGESTTIWFGTGGIPGARVFHLDMRKFADVSTASWNDTVVPLAGGTASAGIFSLALRGSISLIAVGGDYAKPEQRAGTAAFSTDGGKSWTAAATPPGGYRSAVAWDPNDRIWITVGPNGSDYSADDGKTWQPLEHAASAKPGEWNALSLPWVAGPNGRIAKLNREALPPEARSAASKPPK